MAKFNLSDILGSFLSVTGINNRFQKVEDEFNEKVLYRDNPPGEPNQMESDLDMNSNDIINVGRILTDDGDDIITSLNTNSVNVVWTDNDDGSWTLGLQGLVTDVDAEDWPRDIVGVTPNINITKNPDNVYFIEAIDLGGGDVFRNFDNVFGSGFTQTFGTTVHDVAVVNGVDVTTKFNSLDASVSANASAASNAQSTANSAQASANAAQATANSKLSAPVQESQLSSSVQAKLNQSVPSVSVTSGIRYLDADGDNWSSSSAGRTFSFNYTLLKIGNYQRLSGRVQRLSGGNSSIVNPDFRYSSTPGISGFSNLSRVAIEVSAYDNASSGSSQSGYSFGITSSKVGIAASLANSGDVLLGYSVSIEGTI